MKKIEVVAAAILSVCGQRVFIAKRHAAAHQGGLWEFPGGKKEAGESAQAALYRELQEEVAINVIASHSLIKLSHDYGDKCVELDVYKVTAFSGEPRGAEGQVTRWVPLNELQNFEFPA
ncbi:MAG: 8-oxo-dGTP diphosphatase MutT, partial [Bermanella sp.]